MKGDGEKQEEKAAFIPLVNPTGIHAYAQCNSVF